MRADFIDPEGDRRRPAREILDDLLAACAPHAVELGCEAELASVAALADDPGDQRQRMLAASARASWLGRRSECSSPHSQDFTAAPRERVALA